MSRGPGQIERRIAELFAVTRDRALSISDIADAAYRLDGRRATREQRLSATRAAHSIHDLGGTAEMFRKLVEARDRLLAALGSSAPPPKPPEYAPAGVQVVYRARRFSGRLRLGATRLLPK